MTETNAVLHWIPRPLYNIIIAMMKREGRNFSICELCLQPMRRFTLHHTKYEGATYYNLKIACYKCQVKPENRYLD